MCFKNVLNYYAERGASDESASREFSARAKATLVVKDPAAKVTMKTPCL